MTREIKYRAWLKDEKKMVEVSSIDFRIEEITYEEQCNLANMQQAWYEFRYFNDIELIEYTGLKDKNGVEIFEGDIVRTYRLNVDKYLKDRTREYDEFIGVVVWNEEYLTYYIQKNNNEYEDFLKPFQRDYEVIGNVWEHKHLLGEKNDS